MWKLDSNPRARETYWFTVKGPCLWATRILQLTLTSNKGFLNVEVIVVGNKRKFVILIISKWRQTCSVNKNPALAKRSRAFCRLNVNKPLLTIVYCSRVKTSEVVLLILSLAQLCSKSYGIALQDVWTKEKKYRKSSNKPPPLLQ